MKYISTYFDKDLSSDITQSRITSVVAAFVGILVLAFYFNHEGIFHISHSIGISCYYTDDFHLFRPSFHLQKSSIRCGFGI